VDVADMKEAEITTATPIRPGSSAGGVKKPGARRRYTSPLARAAFDGARGDRHFRPMGSRDPTTFEDLLARGKDAADAAAAADAGAGPAAATAETAGPDAAQGAVRVALGGILWQAFGRPAQAGTGWWFVSGVELQPADQDAWRPDLAGFRRRRGEPMPAGRPIRERPDWACEILSAPADKLARAQLHQRRRVPHLWIADTAERTLDTYRWTASGYDLSSRLGPGSTVRAAPFTEIAIAIDEIFGGGR
jgi:Uma2 family endonuclease